MELDSLAGGDLDHSGGVLSRDVMRRYPLSGCKNPPGTEPDHKGIQAFKLFLRPFVPAVPVILLIHAVEFHEGLVIVADSTAQLTG